MNNKKLNDCPKSPNCVSTTTEQSSKKMEPIPFSIEVGDVKTIIKNIILNLPNTKIKEESKNYLHFIFESKFFKFIDDVEFLMDIEQKLIHFRSASRVGYSDLGVNKKRMTKLVKSIKTKINNYKK